MQSTISFAGAARRATALALAALGLALGACGDDDDGDDLTGPGQGVARGRSIFGVDANNTVVVFGAGNPTNFDVRQVAITGLQASESVVGIDFRANATAAADRRLYAVTSGSRVYTVDTLSGLATAVGTAAFTPAVAGATFGVDFNPAADRIRLHSDQDQDLRINQTVTPVVAIVDTALTYLAGDVNATQNPTIAGTAYTNSVSPTVVTGTDLFAIDSDRDVLTFLASPNSGRMATRGTLGVNTTASVGFDIFGPGTIVGGLTGATAYATLTPDGSSRSRLYTINLATGTATLVGDVNYSRPPIGISVAP